MNAPTKPASRKSYVTNASHGLEHDGNKFIIHITQTIVWKHRSGSVKNLLLENVAIDFTWS